MTLCLGQPRVDVEAAGHDSEVVKAVVKFCASQLHDAQPAARRAVFGDEPLEQKNAIDYAADLLFSGLDVVQQQSRTFVICQELLEAEDFAPETQGILGQE